MWKILYHKSPNDVSIQCMMPSRLGIRAKLPSLNRSSSQRNCSLYNHSFAVTVPRLWNTIPSDLHSIADPHNFKIKLTSYLLTKYLLLYTFFMSTNEKLIYGWTMHLLQVGRHGKHGPDFKTLINHHC